MKAEEKKQYVEKLREMMFDTNIEKRLRPELEELVDRMTRSGNPEGLRNLWALYDAVVLSISRTGLGLSYCMTYLGNDELQKFMTEFYDNGYGSALYNVMKGAELLCRLIAARDTPIVPASVIYMIWPHMKEPNWSSWAGRIHKYAEDFSELSAELWNEKDWRDTLWQQSMAEVLDEQFGHMYRLIEIMTEQPPKIQGGDGYIKERRDGVGACLKKLTRRK